MARVQVINEATIHPNRGPEDWSLWIQWCRYIYDDGGTQMGYRTIWRRPPNAGGGLQAARGQARIPSLSDLKALMDKAVGAGWGDYDADTMPEGPPALPTPYPSRPKESVPAT